MSLLTAFEASAIDNCRWVSSLPITPNRADFHQPEAFSSQTAETIPSKPSTYCRCAISTWLARLFPALAGVVLLNVWRAIETF